MSKKRTGRQTKGSKRQRVVVKDEDLAEESEPTVDTEVTNAIKEPETPPERLLPQIEELTSSLLMSLSPLELKTIAQSDPDLKIEDATFNPSEDGKGPSLEGDWRQQITAEEPFDDREASILITSWNVNGLRAILKSTKLGNDENPLGDLGRYLDIEKPDIICLNETKLNHKICQNLSDEYLTDQYVVHHALSEKPGYAGVAVLISKASNLSSCVEEVIIGCEHPSLDEEGRAVAIVFKGLILIATYVLNSGQGLARLSTRITQFDEHLQTWIYNAHKTKNRPIIWCGDLNCARATMDIWNSKANWKSSGHTWQERLSMTKFLKNSEFEDLWRMKNPKTRKYTFWPARAPQQRQANLGWRLDSFIGSKEVQKNLQFVAIRDKVSGSDHCPVVMAVPRILVTGKTDN